MPIETERLSPPRRSHRHNEVPFGQTVFVIDRGIRQRRRAFRQIEFQQRQVEVLVEPDHFSRECPAVIQQAADALRLVDHMPVRKQLPVRRDEDAGTGNHIVLGPAAFEIAGHDLNVDDGREHLAARLRHNLLEPRRRSCVLSGAAGEQQRAGPRDRAKRYVES